MLIHLKPYCFPDRLCWVLAKAPKLITDRNQLHHPAVSIDGAVVMEQAQESASQQHAFCSQGDAVLHFVRRWRHPKGAERMLSEEQPTSS